MGAVTTLVKYMSYYEFHSQNNTMKKRISLFINTDQYVALIVDGIASGGGSLLEVRNTCMVTKKALLKAFEE